jgi:hypothetical protein
MNSKIKLVPVFLIALFAFIFVSAPSISLADDFATNPNAELVPCGSSAHRDECKWADLVHLANNIVNFLVFISSMLGVLAFCYAGFLYITAAGDSGKVEQAHGIFKMVMIGMMFVLCGWLLIATILKILVGDADLANMSQFVDFKEVKTLENQ